MINVTFPVGNVNCQDILGKFGVVKKQKKKQHTQLFEILNVGFVSKCVIS